MKTSDDARVRLGAERLAQVCEVRAVACRDLAIHYALKPRCKSDYAAYERYTSESVRAERLARRYRRLALRGVA